MAYMHKVIDSMFQEIRELMYKKYLIHSALKKI